MQPYHYPKSKKSEFDIIRDIILHITFEEATAQPPPSRDTKHNGNLKKIILCEIVTPPCKTTEKITGRHARVRPV